MPDSTPSVAGLIRQERHRIWMQEFLAKASRGRCQTAAAVAHLQITALLDRHASGDWGDLDADDKAAND